MLLICGQLYVRPQIDVSATMKSRPESMVEIRVSSNWDPERNSFKIINFLNLHLAFQNLLIKITFNISTELQI